jgi:hypothetical protein
MSIAADSVTTDHTAPVTFRSPFDPPSPRCCTSLQQLARCRSVRRASGQPPATAGMIEIRAPSLTSASNPPMKRTSSSPT